LVEFVSLHASMTQGTTISRHVNVSKGLFVMRYAASRGGVDAPSARIIAPPGAGVEVYTADTSGSAVLSAVGDACMVRAATDSTVTVEVEARYPGSSTDAHFELERLTQSAIPRARRSAPASRRTPQPVTSPAILAHVSRQGDMLVEADEWVCGPHSPLVIEGLQLVWPDRPDGVDVMMGCLTSDSARRIASPVPSGAFVGSRGRATQILGLTLSLIGPEADAYEIGADVLFLGSRVVSRSGRSLEFNSPTGHEPLVGLRLSVAASAQVHKSETDTMRDIVLPPFLSRTRDDFSGSVIAVSSLRPMSRASDGTSDQDFVASGRALGERPGTGSAHRQNRVRVFRASSAQALHK
jgi:hypothetical protein